MHDYFTDIIIIYDYYCIYYGTVFCSCFFTAIVCVASVPTDYKCGYLPRELTLKRGERQTLIFWNDRVYDQPPLKEDNSETINDEFLDAVNKPGDVDSNVEMIETTTEVFEENEQSETTTNIRLPEINRLT